MMGGFGSIQGMITSLRNNKSLLGNRKRIFYKARSFAELKEEFRRVKREEITIPEAPKAVKDAIRERLRNEYIKRLRKRIIGLGVIIILSSSLAGYVLLLPVSSSQTNQQPPYYHKENTENGYQQAITDGVEQLKSGNYFLAIGNFENALQLKPKDETAQRLLDNAYQQWCQVNPKICDKLHQ